jgi:N-acetylornithine carbamoyltransferase
MAELRHLLDWHLLPDAVWESRIEAAIRASSAPPPLEAARGKSVALLFFNPSLRTRSSMELAAMRLGAHSSTIVPGQGTWGFAWDEGTTMDGAEAEHIREAVGVLSEYYDAIGVRLFASLTDREADASDLRLKQFARAARVPVVNLESAAWHPCQALADAATIVERFDGAAAGRRFVLAWAHHPKALPAAVPNSALLAAARLGMHVTVARPDGFALSDDVMGKARAYAAARGGSVEETTDPDAAFDGADIVYAKAWAGRSIYDDPAAEESARAGHRDWRVTAERMRRTREAAFMHCLPVRRNVVVDDAVLDGPSAIHLRQAAYRLWAQQAILSWMWDLPDAGGGA